MNVPTPHLEMKKEDVADLVLMPGDPLRAKMIANKYLKNPVLINSVRNVLGYTGFYKDKRVSVIASGMGIASIGIYSYELYKFYDVNTIIRIGSAGSYDSSLDVRDIVIVKDAYSESTYAKCQNGFEGDIISATDEINFKLKLSANNLGINLKEITVHSSDVFYRESFDFEKLKADKGCVAVEMESFGLFHNAKVLNKNAACLLTISDSLVTGKSLPSKDREQTLTDMIEVALNI